MADRSRHPWVSEVSCRISLALQPVAARASGDPGAAILRAGLLAESYGYEAFVLGDHPAWAPECWLHLAVVASRTARIRVGQMVAAVPYRTPLLTARLQSDLDRLSGGRSILGLGIGWNASDYGLGENEFSRMGIPYPPVRERQAALEEAIAIVRGLWGADSLTFDGAFYSTTNARVDPPIQEGGVPLVIGGGGATTLDQVARLADIANFGPGPAGNVSSPDDARQRIDILKGACERANRDFGDILCSHFAHWVILAPNPSAVERKVQRYFPNGLDAFWGSFLVAGTPANVAEYYQGYVDAGIRHFVVQTLDPDDEETIALGATEMLPMMSI